MITAALDVARRGFRVFPVHGVVDGACTCGATVCPSAGKHPIVSGWQDAATNDEAQLVAWWEAYPVANVGVLTAGLLVLDVDPRNHGEAALESLAADHAEVIETLAVATGGGGLHLYFRAPDRKWHKGIAGGLDVKAGGGCFVVGPGSVHVSGARYEWVGATQIADAPQWLVERATAGNTAPKASTGPVDWPDPGPAQLGTLRQIIADVRRSKASSNEPIEKDRADVLGRMLDGKELAPAGDRNNTRTRLMGLLGFILPPGTRWGTVLELVRPCYLATNSDPDHFARHLEESRRKYQETMDLRLVEDAKHAATLVELRQKVHGARERDGHTVTPPPLQPENLTDAGNGERFARHHGDRVRYVKKSKAWLVWDGRRWQRDDTGEVQRLAKDVARVTLLESAHIEDEDRRKRLAGHALKMESARALACMLDLAKWEAGIAITPEQLDGDHYLLNVENGTLDLRTGDLRPHRREDMITRLVPVAYDAAATAPQWSRFLERILPSAALRGFVQRFVGYSLTGDTSEHAFAIFFGVGQNGKGTLVETLRAVVGDYMRVAEASTLLVKKGEGPRNDVAALAGARLVTASETESGRKLAEGLIKSLTGGDMVTARFLFGEFFEFKPTFKLILSTNYRPAVSGSDVGIWRRIRLVPFDVVIPEAERDEGLGRKLLAELPGILAWAVEGCRMWQRDGLGAPEEVRTATAEYRHEMDPLGDFLAAECDLTRPEAKTATAALYDAYRRWGIAHGVELLDQRRLVDLLPGHGMTPARIGKQGARGWAGVQLNSEKTRTALQMAVKKSA